MCKTKKTADDVSKREISKISKVTGVDRRTYIYICMQVDIVNLLQHMHRVTV